MTRFSLSFSELKELYRQAKWRANETDQPVKFLVQNDINCLKIIWLERRVEELEAELETLREGTEPDSIAPINSATSDSGAGPTFNPSRYRTVTKWMSDDEYGRYAR